MLLGASVHRCFCVPSMVISMYDVSCTPVLECEHTLACQVSLLYSCRPGAPGLLLRPNEEPLEAVHLSLYLMAGTVSIAEGQLEVAWHNDAETGQPLPASRCCAQSSH